MPLFDQGMMQGQDPRGLLAKLMMLLRGGGGAGGAFPPAPGLGGLPPTNAFPEAPTGAGTDMSMAGPWGAGFPPAPPDPTTQPTPTPTPRPDPDHVLDGGGSLLIGTSQGRPDPRARGTNTRLNRGQY